MIDLITNWVKGEDIKVFLKARKISQQEAVKIILSRQAFIALSVILALMLIF